MPDNDQFDKTELAVLLRELNAVLAKQIEGDVVELGCYKGLTSLEILRVINGQKQLYMYDSFEGLPGKASEDASPSGFQFVAGELPASKKDVQNLFKKSGLPMPVIKKAWFNELEPSDLPDSIALAFLDGDFYDSILDSLALIWPKLSKGAVVLVDDYQNEALPGVQTAVDRWISVHPAHVRVEASLAVITI